MFILIYVFLKNEHFFLKNENEGTKMVTFLKYKNKNGYFKNIGTKINQSWKYIRTKVNILKIKKPKWTSLKKKKKQPKSTKVKSIENKVVFQPNFLKSLYTKFALICFECLNI